ncbi:hypothetical protein HOG98_04000 [bacterium]|jgi:hypothetical protein|nr:hypothetical protein [bacterium]
MKKIVAVKELDVENDEFNGDELIQDILFLMVTGSIIGLNIVATYLEYLKRCEIEMCLESCRDVNHPGNFE